MLEHSAAIAALLALEAGAQGQVRVSALQGGTFTLPKKFFVSGATNEEFTRVPSLSFLLTQTRGADRRHKRTLFDLGLRRDISTYTPEIQDHLKERLPIQTTPDVLHILTDSGLKANDIDQVILSHVHWDHIGTPSDFPQAKFLVGAGSLSLLERGINGHMSHSNFQHDLFQDLDVTELSEPNSWDLMGGLRMLELGDSGLVYVVDSPGHLMGHISLLVRTGCRKWAWLIGDACHDKRLLTGEQSIAEWIDSEGRTCCIHMDKAKATETLEIFAIWKRASEECDVALDIIFAHDVEWAESHADAFLPGAL
ncbi:uncharacterized protein FMAN_10966 [Fusarium mangiferae]|uniref:Metallo-beta-lactamase domain-containing protein n=1 Tax=Fusarium mangiferae TaxID=192010 RepID=A0A1L7TPC0_FUSMA|nr:uncharacterized protein FMAN_10966 [Fusarium mangiferae]CVK96636.1 uncharacterized protein FMAN_10966 [Fusarium mangiferae]